MQYIHTVYATVDRGKLTCLFDKVPHISAPCPLICYKALLVWTLKSGFGSRQASDQLNLAMFVRIKIRFFTRKTMHENCLNSIFFNSYKLNIFFLKNTQKIGYLKKSRIALKIKELEYFKIRWWIQHFLQKKKRLTLIIYI